MKDLAAIAADFGAIEITTTSLIERDDMLYFMGQVPSPVEVEVKFTPEAKAPLWDFEFGEAGSAKSLVNWQMQAYVAMMSKTLKRPSWLHPIKRILWVHHHGPHQPIVRVPTVNLDSMGVIRNVT
jgi:hypothetical protein